MTRSPSLWMHSTLSDCCTHNYNWMLKACLESSSSSHISSPTPQFISKPASVSTPMSWYPGWNGSNSCFADGNEPEYMKVNPSLWMFSTLTECCNHHFAWSLSTCDPYRSIALGSSSSSSSSSLRTSEWCMSWSKNKCTQECASWDATYIDQSECCSDR